MTKKISGIYLDNQGYIYHIFYVWREWIVKLSNRYGAYCGHSHYTTRDIKKMLSGLTKVT